MESKRTNEADDGADVVPNEPRPTDNIEPGTETFEILYDAVSVHGRMLLAIWQPSTNEVHPLPPRLLGVAFHRTHTSFTELVGCSADGVRQIGRWFEQQRREAQLPRQPFEGLIHERERVGAKLVERCGSDLGGDERVSIAISTHPGPEGEARQGCRSEQTRVVTRRVPCSL